MERDSRSNSNQVKSLLAPIILGMRPEVASTENLVRVGRLVAYSIPIGEYSLTQVVGQRPSRQQEVKHQRIARVLLPGDGRVNVRYVDQVLGAEVPQLHSVQWQLSLWPGSDSHLFPSLAAGQSPIVVTISAFRLYRGWVTVRSSSPTSVKQVVTFQCGKQLALARFALVEAFRVLDSEITVASLGQLGWDGNWWSSLVVTAREGDVGSSAGVRAVESAESLLCLTSGLDVSPKGENSSCANCGTPVRKASRFCGNCGENLEPGLALENLNLKDGDSV